MLRASSDGPATKSSPGSLGFTLKVRDLTFGGEYGVPLVTSDVSSSINMLPIPQLHLPPLIPTTHLE
nr:hypothetical protein [Tanacetum cinerariifolium]